MGKQTMQMPEKCNECFGTKYQIENCPYQCVMDLKDIIEKFKEIYDIDLKTFGLDITPIVQKAHVQKEKCLKKMDQRIQQIALQQEKEERDRQMKDMQNIITNLSEKVDQMLAGQTGTMIFQEQEEVDAPMRKVQKKKIKIEKKTNDGIPDLIPHGGWKIYQANTKEENVPKFIEALRKKHPELSEEIDIVLDGGTSDAVRIDENKNMNMMIRYREMVDPSTIQ